jgi:polyphosphate kinase 2 (PPK2 family)
MLIDNDIRLFKYWFSVCRDEQFSRFQDRKKDPLKRWKLSCSGLIKVK